MLNQKLIVNVTENGWLTTESPDVLDEGLEEAGPGWGSPWLSVSGPQAGVADLGGPSSSSGPPMSPACTLLDLQKAFESIKYKKKFKD